MSEMNEKIKNSLISIDFVKRYEELSKRFDSDRTPSDNRLVYIDGEEVMDMIKNLGYDPLFDTKEKFFKIKEEKTENMSFGFHIILRDGLVEMVWVVRQDKEVLLGSPFGTYAKRLIDPGYRIKNPVIGSYDDLEEVLKTAFEMYEDFKKAVN